MEKSSKVLSFWLHSSSKVFAECINFNYDFYRLDSSRYHFSVIYWLCVSPLLIRVNKARLLCLGMACLCLGIPCTRRPAQMWSVWNRLSGHSLHGSALCGHSPRKNEVKELYTDPQNSRLPTLLGCFGCQQADGYHKIQF